jgi:hypothetical protein
LKLFVHFPSSCSNGFTLSSPLCHWRWILFIIYHTHASYHWRTIHLGVGLISWPCASADEFIFQPLPPLPSQKDNERLLKQLKDPRQNNKESSPGQSATIRYFSTKYTTSLQILEIKLFGMILNILLCIWFFHMVDDFRFISEC